MNTEYGKNVVSSELIRIFNLEVRFCFWFFATLPKEFTSHFKTFESRGVYCDLTPSMEGFIFTFISDCS